MGRGKIELFKALRPLESDSAIAVAIATAIKIVIKTKASIDSRSHFRVENYFRYLTVFHRSPIVVPSGVRKLKRDTSGARLMNDPSQSLRSVMRIRTLTKRKRYISLSNFNGGLD